MKKTKEIEDRIVELLPKKNYHIGKVCKAVNISRGTYYKWVDEDEDFKAKIDDAFQFDIDDSEEKLKLLRQGLPKFEEVDGVKKFVGWIEKPHFPSLALHLESKAKDRGYGKSIEINRKVDDLRKMTDEELLAELGDIGKSITEDEWDMSQDGDEDGEG